MYKTSKSVISPIINMVKGKRIIYAKVFDGEPNNSNFKLEEYDVASPKDGEILCAAEYLSVDPYMRPYMMNYPVGTTMIGGQIAKIIESKNKKFPVGSYVFGDFGWKTHTLVSPSEPEKGVPPTENNPYVLPDFGGVSRSLGLGYLGMPGNTSYFGFLEICQPKPGETVVVNGAAGAVGSHVGQIAKIKGCKVIGIAGSDEKCEWLTNDLGFDHAFNYKTCDLSACLKTAAPKGVDCFFDNVGGQMSSTIIGHMNKFGRISVCGAISSYNDKKRPTATILQPDFVFRQLKMEGFLVYRWCDRYMEGIKTNLKWIQEGKIKYVETFTEGFENMPKAFMEMLKGGNTGKAVVKV